MSTCKYIKKQTRKICAADLDKQIVVYARSITAAKDDSPDFTETLTQELSVRAMVKTSRGDMLFDGVNLSTGVTHKFYTRYFSQFTFEDRIKFQGDIYEVLDVENLDEDNKFMLFRCKKSGDQDTVVNRL